MRSIHTEFTAVLPRPAEAPLERTLRKHLQGRGRQTVSGTFHPRFKLDIGVTGFLSALENDALDDVRARFRSVLDLGPSDEEPFLSRHLAETVATRAARLCACGIAAICRKRGIESGHVATDASVANKHPKFRAR